MTFEAQPTLFSALIHIRPLCADDKDALFAVAADPLIWEQHPASNRYLTKEFEDFFSEAMHSGGALLITDAYSSEVIGSSRYFGYHQKRSEVEIGWTFLARSHWGGVYNAELKRLMLGHAFKYVSTVLFYVDAGNKRSQRSVEKIGGVMDADPDRQGRVVYRVDLASHENNKQPFSR
ncbi:MAG: GNAT family N-acetyltransferase [Pseudomonadota bacterium]